MSTQPLAGHLSVDESARRVRQYRYVEERMMRILGGWIALTPELPAKLLFGRHVWDCAQHADLWGRRLPELRAPAQKSEPANDRVVRVLDLLETAERPHDTARRIAGVYRVLKPHLIAVYERHLAAANVIYEPPTRRILDRCLAEERRHVASGATIFNALVPSDSRPDIVAEWEARLIAALADAGGVTGDDPTLPLATVPPPVDPAVLAQDLVVAPAPFDPGVLAPDLAGAVTAYAEALRAGREPDVPGELDPPALEAVRTIYRHPEGPWASVHVVALSSIGHAYRIVKLAFERPDRRVVLQLRWKQVAGTWVVVGADLARDEPHG